MDRPGAGSYRMPLAMWLLFGAIFLSFLVGGAFFYYSQERRIREDESQKLLSIAELKAEEIARWRSERIGDATVALSGPFFSAAVKQWLATPDPTLAAQITERLESYRRGYRYASAFIVDAEGHIRLSAGMAEEHISLETDAFLRISLRQGRPFLSELYRCSVHNAVHLDVIAPLFSDTTEGRRAVAALILRVDPNEFLYPLIQSWPEQSISAETLLVRRDGDEVVFLNELRLKKGTALNLRIPISRFDIPAVRAVRGEEGIIEGLDYRGVPVLSALKQIPASSWYMVAKIDSAEAFSAWRFRAGVIIGGLCLVVYIIFSLMGFFWHIQRGKQYKELLELEKKEREGEEYFRATFEQSGVGVSQVAFGGRFMKVNPRFCEIVGYSSEELLQKSFPEITHPDDRAADKIYIQKILEGGKAVSSREKRYIRKDGSIVWSNVTVTVVRDASGAPSYFLPVVEDISSRKDLELAREELMTSLQHKNEEMESILYAASHDLRSPLVNIQGFSDRIRRYLAELDRILNAQISASEMCETAAPIIRNNIPKALGYVTAGTDKMDALVSGLLKLSRLGRATHTPEPIDMNELMRETLDALKFQTQEARAVVTVGDLPSCWGDRREIGQAFSNLVDNAIKYRDPKRPLTITVSGTVMGDRVTYTVADTGIGIKKGHQDQIWGLFSRLDPGGPVPGEGLGLALVKRIVQRNRGKAWLESEQGKGTVFYIVLPQDRTIRKGGRT
ncbi:MAG TPA: PAS domain S-box protein [bacterium]|nr:PAS domain S-box protein [bacterium]